MASIDIFEQNGDALVSFLELSESNQEAIYPALHPSFQLALECLQALSRDEFTANSLAKNIRIHKNTASQFLRVLAELELVHYEEMPNPAGGKATRIYKLSKGGN